MSQILDIWPNGSWLKLKLCTLNILWEQLLVHITKHRISTNWAWNSKQIKHQRASISIYWCLQKKVCSWLAGTCNWFWYPPCFIRARNSFFRWDHVHSAGLWPPLDPFANLLIFENGHCKWGRGVLLCSNWSNSSRKMRSVKIRLLKMCDCHWKMKDEIQFFTFSECYTPPIFPYQENYALKSKPLFSIFILKRNLKDHKNDSHLQYRSFIKKRWLQAKYIEIELLFSA